MPVPVPRSRGEGARRGRPGPGPGRRARPGSPAPLREPADRALSEASDTLRATDARGLVPERPAEEWTRVGIDITDAHGERLYREWTFEEVAAACDRARARAEADAPVVIIEPR